MIVRVRLLLAFGFVVALAVTTASVFGESAAFAIALPIGLALAWWIARAHDERAEQIAAALRDIGAGREAGWLAWQRPKSLARVAGAINDLSRQMSERLRGSVGEQERLRAVLNSMVEGVLVLDADGRTLLANRRLRELFDIWGDVEGRTALEVIRRNEVHDAIRTAFGGSSVGIEIEVGGRFVEMHAVRFPASGEPLGTVAVFHDITEIRQLERMRKDFVANVSHELRTPLTAIRGFAETLMLSDVPKDQRDRQLGVILRHSERLADLIEDLLELSRIEGQHARVEAHPVDVVALCRTVLHDLKPRFEDHAISHTLDATTAAPALADRRSLERVLLNLLDNALKYTEPGDEIRIHVSESGGKIQIEVIDTGIGIPPEDLGRVFERFYRVEKARSRDHGGTGLGLAIVKHLVQAMGGDVRVESADGEGTTVRVRLPLENAPTSTG